MSDDSNPYAPPGDDAPQPDPGPARAPLLPFLRRYPILIGALVGVLMRVVAELPGLNHVMSVMALPFIYGTPVAVGMVTVYLAERQRRRSWGYYLGASSLAAVLFVVGTLLIMVEGWICAVVIIPLFTVVAAIAGLVMGAVCRATHWPKPVVYGVGALPLAFSLLSGLQPAADTFGVIAQSRQIEASTEVVWQQLNNARDIRPHEVDSAWAYRIGVPLPVSGVTEETPQGRVRHSVWGKGVRFEEVIHTWEPGRHLGWSYRFAPDSFPPGALDDHVVIGGRYFDLLDTDYRLTPTAQGGTQLDMRIRYRVSTQFNFYADRVAQILLDDFSAVILNFYARRSERAAAPLNGADRARQAGGAWHAPGGTAGADPASRRP